MARAAGIPFKKCKSSLTAIAIPRYLLFCYRLLNLKMEKLKLIMKFNKRE